MTRVSIFVAVVLTAFVLVAVGRLSEPVAVSAAGANCKGCDDTYSVCLQNVPTNSDRQKADERKRVCADQRDRCYKAEGCASRNPNKAD